MIGVKQGRHVTASYAEVGTGMDRQDEAGNGWRGLVGSEMDSHAQARHGEH